jgi:hypothetical protein
VTAPAKPIADKMAKIAKPFKAPVAKVPKSYLP